MPRKARRNDGTIFSLDLTSLNVFTHPNPTGETQLRKWKSDGHFSTLLESFLQGVHDVMVMTCPHGETFDKCRLGHW